MAIIAIGGVHIETEDLVDMEDVLREREKGRLKCPLCQSPTAQEHGWLKCVACTWTAEIQADE